MSAQKKTRSYKQARIVSVRAEKPSTHTHTDRQTDRQTDRYTEEMGRGNHVSARTHTEGRGREASVCRHTKRARTRSHTDRGRGEEPVSARTN